MKTSERVIWAMIGASIGAGIALLYAPKSGKDTRRLLKRKAEDARDVIVETGEHLRDRFTDTSESILNAGRDVYKRASSAVGGASDILDSGFRRSRS